MCIWYNLILVVLYAISAVYFAGVMVRLMLTLTPCVCVLAAIAFSKLFNLYLNEDKNQKKQDGEASDDETDGTSCKMYDKVNKNKFMSNFISFSYKIEF